MNSLFKKHFGLTALCMASILVLGGCAKKPPACSDAAVTQTIRTIIVDNATVSQDPFIDDDPQKIQEGYFQALKNEIGNVVSDGYNDQAKKFSCRGSLSVSTATGQKFTRNIVYSTQRTESKDSDFLVEVEEFQPFITAVTGDMYGYFVQKRYKGEWTGTYDCAGIDNAQDGPQGPFSMPVTMVVDDKMQAIMERTTKGGGVERIAGHIEPFIRLRGEGQNNSDDTWRTSFEGRVKGLDFTASGKIETPERRVLRQCTLKLKLPS